MNIKRPLTRFWLSPAASNAIFPSIVLLLFRLGFGWDLIVTAWWGHLPNAPQMIHRFQSWGVPLPHFSFYVSAYAELICGGLLMLGIAARFVSIPLVFNFLVAYATASRDNVISTFTQGFKAFPTAVASNIIEDTAFPFLLTALLVLAFGAGLFSLDFLIGWIIKKRPQR